MNVITVCNAKGRLREIHHRNKPCSLPRTNRAFQESCSSTWTRKPSFPTGSKQATG